MPGTRDALAAICDAVAIEAAGIDLFTAKTRAFKDLLDAVPEAEANASLLLVDSLTHFWVELTDLIGAALGNEAALKHIIDVVTLEGMVRPTKLTETTIMLVVLGLIDVVMISNLLVMVIIGGYETFVSRLGLDGHPDQPEWLSHVNASVLKVKLAMAIIGISSIHLLKTFINVKAYSAQEHAACLNASARWKNNKRRSGRT